MDVLESCCEERQFIIDESCWVQDDLAVYMIWNY